MFAAYVSPATPALPDGYVLEDRAECRTLVSPVDGPTRQPGYSSEATLMASF
jgi:hypothetical protein